MHRPGAAIGQAYQLRALEAPLRLAEQQPQYPLLHGGEECVGQTRRGTLEPGDWTMSDGTFADVWYFVAQSGQRVTVELVSRSFDSYLQLLDPGGTRLADNDDGLGRDRGARIAFTAPAAGRYQIVVNNYDEDQRTGAYTLVLR